MARAGVIARSSHEGSTRRCRFSLLPASISGRGRGVQETPDRAPLGRRKVPRDPGNRAVVLAELGIACVARNVRQLDQHRPSISRVAGSPNPPRALQSVDQSGCRARREADPLLQFARRQWTAGLEMLERMQVDRGQTGLAGELDQKAIAREAERMELLADLLRRN